MQPMPCGVTLCDLKFFCMETLIIQKKKTNTIDEATIVMYNIIRMKDYVTEITGEVTLL